MADRKQNKYTNPAMATFTGIRDLFRRKNSILTLKDEERLDGKRVLVTGASSGLGFAIAVRLAERGAHVIMACRSGIPEKGEEVRRRLRDQGIKGPGGQETRGEEEKGRGGEKEKGRREEIKVDMVKVDFTDFDSVRRMVKEVKERFGTIDMYVCNAAVVVKQARKTKYGLDEMFQVNYLSKFYTANLLISEGIIKSENGGTPRIIFVASESHRNAAFFEWDKFGKFVPYGPGKTVGYYGYNKLLLVTYVNELSRRINPDGKVNYSVFALCPGPVNSNIAREAPALFMPLLKLVFGIFFRHPMKASDPVIYLACAKEQEGRNLDYLFLMNRKEMDDKAIDPENGKMLWEKSEELVGSLLNT
jgi:NAD(P)-dependent dehydrogenase (short-subunit alcohol dehydrogenase family)